MNYEVNHFKDWSFFNSATHCKMVFWASNHLNGKMVVKLQSKEDADVHVFKMPKKFNTKRYPYQGLFENNDYRTYQRSGVYEVPSDWIVYIQYNVGIFDGNMRVSSWVEDYAESDVEKIKKEWQPTGTYWVDKKKLEAERQARLAKEKRDAEELAKKLKEAAD